MIEHELAHETCGLEGCTYTASVKQVEIHILHLHSNGLYQKQIKQKSLTCSDKVNPDEESKKWREERKKNFPSVSKSEQAKRQRKLKYDRKIKSIETRRQKELEREEEWKKRQEEKEKLSDSKVKRQSRRKKRKNPEHEELQHAPTVSVSEEVISLEISINTEKNDIHVKENDPEANIAKKTNSNVEKSKRTKLAIPVDRDSAQGAKRNFDMVLNKDLPFWYGYIEPFKGTKYDYDKTSVSVFHTEVRNSSLHPDRKDKQIDAVTTKNTFDQYKESDKTILKNVRLRENNPCINLEKTASLQNASMLNKSMDYDSDDEPPDESPILRESSIETPCTVANKGSEIIFEEKQEKEYADMCPPGTDADPVDDIFANNSKKQENAIEPQRSICDTSSMIDKTSKRKSFKILRKSIHPPTLLEKLLITNIEKERDELLQCIRYVCDNDFLQKK